MNYNQFLRRQVEITTTERVVTATILGFDTDPSEGERVYSLRVHAPPKFRPASIQVTKGDKQDVLVTPPEEENEGIISVSLVE